ncbi:ABC transporter permease (plasmid) [Deinococcus psychrotolerans]|uniref:ABC transporter permease n=1 Tax=Deinococcus psychrotolerans TaxID=2489213 RepID=A0A3G8YJ43_9DEIO|nr:ABC transporter permease [Deinococcus psychrotolerans]AZI44935.1 ABC transporter permease [Deinococcus psychrotolerans]
MSDAASNAALTAQPRAPRRLLKLNGYLTIGGALMLILALLSLLAPLLSRVDPNMINPALALQPLGSPDHLLGTDNLGRDLLSRLLYGGRISLLSSFTAALISTAISATVGLTAAFFGRWIDLIALRVTDILMGFPFILLAILLVAALGPSTFNALLAVAIANLPFTLRLVRSEAIRVREREFITAAKALGAGNSRIIWMHMLPNVLSVLISTFFLTAGWMLGQTSALSFLGLGTQPPTADWGSMLAESQNYMSSMPQIAMLPGLMIVLASVGMNLFGVGLRAAALREK